ncbi:MAG TPA: ABC transporter permease [Polyangiaceae bacterium]|nr:ABC transporter permease [Polyangiaceae bacterium]
MSTGSSPVIRITPSRSWTTIGWRELWEYRELLYFLMWRDIKLRYKQTALGAAWAILQPVLTMLVFSLFFGKLAKMPTDGLPYPLFALSALVLWTFFANGLTMASSSLVNNANLLRKVYFPRLAVPIAAVLSGLVDFVVTFIVLIGAMAYFGYSLTLRAFAVPPLLLLTLLISLGVGLWLAALSVAFRDVKYVVPYATQLWMFITPIVYPSSLLSAHWRTLYALNPMVGIIEGFRWAMLGSKTAPGPLIVSSSVAAVVILIGGALFFRRLEKTFADVI